MTPSIDIPYTYVPQSPSSTSSFHNPLSLPLSIRSIPLLTHSFPTILSRFNLLPHPLLPIDSFSLFYCSFPSASIFFVSLADPTNMGHSQPDDRSSFDENERTNIKSCFDTDEDRDSNTNLTDIDTDIEEDDEDEYHPPELNPGSSVKPTVYKNADYEMRKIRNRYFATSDKIL